MIFTTVAKLKWNILINFTVHPFFANFNNVFVDLCHKLDTKRCANILCTTKNENTWNELENAFAVTKRYKQQSHQYIYSHIIYVHNHSSNVNTFNNATIQHLKMKQSFISFNKWLQMEIENKKHIPINFKLNGFEIQMSFVE